jgi:methionine aminopeptidase
MFGFKTKKKPLKAGSVPSIFAFVHRKPEQINSRRGKKKSERKLEELRLPSKNRFYCSARYLLFCILIFLLVDWPAYTENIVWWKIFPYTTVRI